jgi:hypothetical protein
MLNHLPGLRNHDTIAVEDVVYQVYLIRLVDDDTGLLCLQIIANAKCISNLLISWLHLHLHLLTMYTTIVSSNNFHEYFCVVCPGIRKKNDCNCTAKSF